MKNWWCWSIKGLTGILKFQDFLHQGGHSSKCEWYSLIPLIKATLKISRTSVLDGFWWRTGDVCQSKGVAGILNFGIFCINQGLESSVNGIFWFNSSRRFQQYPEHLVRMVFDEEVVMFVNQGGWPEFWSFRILFIKEGIQSSVNGILWSLSSRQL